MSNKPLGATINPANGEFTWDTNTGDAGSYEVIFTASDGTFEDSETIIITVNYDTPPVNLGMVTVLAGTTSSNNGSVTLGYDIEVAQHEVTHEEFIEFLNSEGVAAHGVFLNKYMIDMDDYTCAVGHNGNSFYFAGSDYAESKDCPVMEVTWYGALAYCNWLSEQEGLNKAYDLNNWELKNSPEYLEGYRLPTENEWEYTVRGGAGGDTTTYAGSNNIGLVAWYNVNSGDKTHPVAQKQSNELGIYDMSGNVWEWTNSTDDSYMVSCGGSWASLYYKCEVDESNSYDTDDTYYNLGFRPVRTK